MKEIVKDNCLDVIEFSNFKLTEGDIVVYETKDNNGLAVLTRLPLRKGYGFVFHSDLIKCRFNDAKFIRVVSIDSIEDALNCGRTVLVFNSFQEFCKHSSKFNY